MADTAGTHREWYNRDYGDTVTAAELQGRTLAQARLERKREIDSYFGREDFFRQLKVMEHSQEVIRELSRHYEIFITTAAMEVPPSFRAKYEWLQEPGSARIKWTGTAGRRSGSGGTALCRAWPSSIFRCRSSRRPGNPARPRAFGRKPYAALG